MFRFCFSPLFKAGSLEGLCKGLIGSFSEGIDNIIKIFKGKV